MKVENINIQYHPVIEKELIGIGPNIIEKLFTEVEITKTSDTKYLFDFHDKKDRVFKSTFNMDSIPGVSEPISIEVKGVPEDTVIAFTGFLDKIKTNGMNDQKDIE